jgi:anti-sigma B factor antagonist
MTHTQQTGGRTAVLVLRGDLDFFTEDDFRRQAEQLLDGQDVDRFVVDLAHVELVDSSGLGLLLDLLRLCREMGLPMALRAVPERVRRLLDLTGLDELIDVE